MLFGMTAEARRTHLLHLARISGARFVILQGRQTAEVDGEVLKQGDIPEGIALRVADRVMAWLRAPDPNRPSTPCSIGLGIDGMAERMGYDPANVRTATRVLGHLAIDDPKGTGRTAHFHHDGRRIRARYAAGGKVTFEHGVVSVRGAGAPATLRAGLVGEPVARLIEDPVLGEMRIRRICSTDPRERIMRIVTRDADRWLTHER